MRPIWPAPTRSSNGGAQAAEPAPDEQPVGEEQPEWATSIDEEEGPLPSDVRFRFLSQGFFIVGLACILLGSIQAWQNGKTLSEYSAATEGLRVGIDFGEVKKIPMPGGPDQPIGEKFFYEFQTPSQYGYIVGGRTYYARVGSADTDANRVTIHYDPHDPAQHVVGTVVPAWLVLSFALAIGAFLMFVGYQFR